MKKKLLAILLATIMVVTLLPTIAFATGEKYVLTLKYNSTIIKELDLVPIEGVTKSDSSTPGNLILEIDKSKVPFMVELKFSLDDGYGIVGSNQYIGVSYPRESISIQSIKEFFGEATQMQMQIQTTEQNYELLQKIIDKQKDGIQLTNFVEPKNTNAMGMMLLKWSQAFASQLDNGYRVTPIPIDTKHVWFAVGFAQEYAFKNIPYEITYATSPDPKIVEKVNKVIENGKFDQRMPGQGYQVDDIDALHFYKDHGTGHSAIGYCAGYSSDFRKAVSGYNLEVKLDVAGAGGGPGSEFFMNCEYGTTLGYEGLSYAYIMANFCLGNVIYIPTSTPKDTTSFIQAAKNKIKQEMGLDVEITRKCSFQEHYNEKYTGGSITYEDWENAISEQIGDINNTCKEVYILTIGGNPFDFLISNNGNKMRETGIITRDIATDVAVEVDSSKVYRDTKIETEQLSENSTEYKKLIELTNLDYAQMYDISLYSESNDKYVSKLDNGKFQVSIPVGQELEGKNLSAFYVDDQGTVEEHKATVKDGYAVFETDHFSTYILGESKVPKTADNNVALIWAIFATLSLLACGLTFLNLSKENL